MNANRGNGLLKDSLVVFQQIRSTEGIKLDLSSTSRIERKYLAFDQDINII
jgi:hypothetical protein